MSVLKIYHNPRCGKSRETLKLIEASGQDVNVVEYLKSPISENEFRDILAKLNLPLEYLIRKNEAIFKEQYKGKEFSDDQWIKILLENPKLIERPIVVKGNKAIIGRPPENVNQLL